jgi:polar amino acid transport system substrate-binding protein
MAHRWARVRLVVFILLWPPIIASAQTLPLRLCADPDNLPFSSENPATPGLYIELGRQLAAALGRPFEPVWTLTYFGKHDVRTTLLAGRCDGFIGLPDDPDFMGPAVVFSKPILRLGYALVTPRGMAVSSLDSLAGRRVAAQFASPPQSVLALRNDIHMVTVLSPAAGMRELANGKVDAAFIWGPSAGWTNRSELRDAYRVVPVIGPYMQWQAAIGFSRSQTGLRDAVDRALDRLRTTIEGLMEKYGFPTGAPISLNHSPARATPTVSPVVGQTAVAPAAAAATSNAQEIAQGHQLFNDNCSHCHGPDAVEGVERRNLRLLHHLYGDVMDQVFMTTVTHGRVTLGMPNWSGILTEGQFHDILAYLHSVQDP